nr:DDE-type integrase/transposase/recombinase [Enterococcus sp.]
TRGFSLSEDSLLYFNNRLFVPGNHQIKLDILQQTHDSSLAGNPGQAKTFALVSRHYFWPRMRAFINTYVQGCQTCQRDKSPRHKPVGLLKPLPIPSGPWRSISMDAIVKLPLSEGYDCIMVIVDRLTKMAHFLPFTEEGFTSVHLAKMMRFIFRLHGIPEDIVSDRGPIFTSKFWGAFASGLDIKLNFSTAYHPQSDGQTERVNQVVEQYIRMYTNYNQDNWVDLLDKAEFTYNNSEHASTKMTPFFANFDYHPLDPSAPAQPIINPMAKSHLEQLADIREELVKNITKAQADYAKFYDRKVKSHLNLEDEPLYAVGDKVWLNAKDYPTSRPSAKLDHKLLGPFTIIERISDLVYRLDLPPTMEVNNSFHISRLEPFKKGHPGQVQQEPPPVIVEGERQYVAERILDGGFEDSSGQYVYLVHWEGYPDSEDTWEPYDEIKHLRIFKKFQSAHKESPEMFPPETPPKKTKQEPVRR